MKNKSLRHVETGHPPPSYNSLHFTTKFKTTVVVTNHRPTILPLPARPP
ncbi:MAG: hypothetical protein ACREE6_07085 [Limisphaerales bacterium]